MYSAYGCLSPYSKINSWAELKPSKPTSCFSRAPASLAKATTVLVVLGERPQMVWSTMFSSPFSGKPCSNDFLPSRKISSLTSPKSIYKSPPSKAASSLVKNGSINQNSIYSIFAFSKSVLSNLRIIPPQRVSGWVSLPFMSISLAEMLYGPRSLG